MPVILVVLYVDVAVCCMLYSTATTRLGRARSNINTKHKFNRHATTNPISLSLVTEVKEKISP